MRDGARVLIVGCGYVGVALGRHLAQSGFRVAGLRRDTTSLPAEIEPVAADLLDRSSLSRISAPWNYVVYLTGARERSPQAYRDAYVTGVRNALDVLAEPGIELACFIFASSTGVYAQSDGSWVDEDTAVGPLSGPAKHLLEGESIVHDGPFPSVVVRFGGIYGPGRGSLVTRIRAGEITRAGATTYANRIHRDDCVGVLHHLMSLTAPDPLYLAVDNEPVEMGRLTAWLAAEMGLSLSAGTNAMQPHRSAQNKRCRNDRLRRSGYEFRYPTFREGYRALLDEGESW